MKSTYVINHDNAIKFYHRYVDLNYGEDTERPEDRDKIFSYACEVLTLGLLYLEFVDAIREADGTRILRCWKFFLLYFKVSGRTNYSIEAFVLLAQEKYLFSPRMAMQLKWSRTVNMHGLPGRNVSCDLHMEHLNRECKNCLSGLSSNIADSSVTRIGKCIGKTEKVLKNFDRSNNVPQESGSHTTKSSKEDMKKLLLQLTEKSKVFIMNEGRSHKKFSDFKLNMLRQLDITALKQWMSKQMQKLNTYT